MRPLRSIEYLSGLRAVIGALSLNTGFVLHLIWFLVVTFILFGCIAIEYFYGSLQRRYAYAKLSSFFDNYSEH